MTHVHVHVPVHCAAGITYVSRSVCVSLSIGYQEICCLPTSFSHHFILGFFIVFSTFLLFGLLQHKCDPNPVRYVGTYAAAIAGRYGWEGLGGQGMGCEWLAGLGWEVWGWVANG